MMPPAFVIVFSARAYTLPCEFDLQNKHIGIALLSEVDHSPQVEASAQLFSDLAKSDQMGPLAAARARGVPLL